MCIELCDEVPCVAHPFDQCYDLLAKDIVNLQCYQSVLRNIIRDLRSAARLI